MTPDTKIGSFVLLTLAGALSASLFSVAALLLGALASLPFALRATTPPDLAKMLRWGLAIAAGSLLIWASAALPAALLWASKILLLYLLATLLAVSLTPLQMAATLARWTRPLARVGVPVADLPLALSLGVLLMPALRREAGRLHAAQASRGIAHGSGNPLKRVRAAPALVATTIARSRARAEEMAISLVMRGYRSDMPARGMSPTWRDAVAIGLAATPLAATLLLDRLAR